MRWSIETSFKELKYNVGWASLHSKKQELIFQKIFSKLIMYNFTALISYSIEVIKDKRINFANAIHLCHRFYRDKIADKVLLEMLQKYLSPIRPRRSYERYQNIKKVIGFAYRIL